MTEPTTTPPASATGATGPGAEGRHVRSSDGVALWVREHGSPDRPTVVLVHGYPDTSALWDGVVALLAGDHHVVTYDVRGAGASDRPPRIADYALTQLSDDLVAVLDATAPGKQVHLVGHDWGGIQCWESAARATVAPRLSSYTAVAGPSVDLIAHGARDRRARGDASVREALTQLVKSWYVMAFHLPFAAPLAWRSFIGPTWPDRFRGSEGVRPPAGHPAPTITRDGVDGIKLYRRNMLERLLRPRYSRVDVPLVQVGITLRDRFIDPHVYDDLSGRMPELWMRRADATHWLPLLDPGVVAGWVRQAVAYREAGGPVPADAEVHVGA